MTETSPCSLDADLVQRALRQERRFLPPLIIAVVEQLDNLWLIESLETLLAKLGVGAPSK